jgi:glutathione S-transferase
MRRDLDTTDSESPIENAMFVSRASDTVRAPMTAAPLTLHGDSFWISPYVFTCFVALREKNLAFEYVDVPLHEGAQHTPGFRDPSLTGRVPALRHGDFWLSESSAIAEYLDECFATGVSLLPKEPQARARARQVMAWIRSDLMALREERSTHTMFYAPATKALSPAGVAAAEKLERVARALVPANAEPLFGAWSIADSDLAFMLHRLLLNGHTVDARVRAWAEAQWQRPSVQAFVTHMRPPYVAYG